MDNLLCTLFEVVGGHERMIMYMYSVVVSGIDEFIMMIKLILK